MSDEYTDGTEQLLGHFESNPTVEVDHAITLYLEPKKRLPWRDTETIREHGYKIQDITNEDVQTKVTLVRSLQPEIDHGGQTDE